MPAIAEQALDLVATNAVLETYTPRQIVDWAAGEFGDDEAGLVMSSSFGAESALLIHLATRVKPDIKVIPTSCKTGEGLDEFAAALLKA
jgi:phosphoadenosine phosphosulfate reductase